MIINYTIAVEDVSPSQLNPSDPNLLLVYQGLIGDTGPAGSPGADGVDGAGSWGNITGDISTQADLQIQFNTKEPVLAAGTITQYYRGDKTWQELPTGGGSLGYTAENIIYKVTALSGANNTTYPTTLAVTSALANTVPKSIVSNTQSGSITTTSTTQVDVHTFDASVYKAAKYLIYARDTVTGGFYMSELLVGIGVLPDVSYGEYSTIASTGLVISLSADYSAPNVRLRVMPFSNNSTAIKYDVILIS